MLQKLLFKFLAGCGFSLLLAFPLVSRAAFTVYVYQSGADVVASYSGALNLAGLVNAGNGGCGGGIGAVQGNSGIVCVGTGNALTRYTGLTSGAFTLGGGAAFLASSSSGSPIIINSNIDVRLPNGYVSGNTITGTSTFAGNTLAGLGLTVGNRVVTWASDSITVSIGTAPPTPSVASVPTLSEYALMALASLVAMFGIWQFKKRRL